MIRKLSDGIEYICDCCECSEDIVYEFPDAAGSHYCEECYKNIVFEDARPVVYEDYNDEPDYDEDPDYD